VWTVGLWYSKQDLTIGVPVSVPPPGGALGRWDLYDPEGNLLSSGGDDMGSDPCQL